MRATPNNGEPEGVWSIVCFVDILGFEYMTSGKEVRGGALSIRDAELIARDFTEILERHVFGDAEIWKTDKLSQPNFSVFSDSVFITLPLANTWNVLKLQIEQLIGGLRETLRECIEREFGEDKNAFSIPVRGSLSIGEVFLDKPKKMSGDHLVGIPVTQAANFEGKQEWVGISFVPQLYGDLDIDCPEEKKEQILKILQHLRERGFIVRWSVPTKSGLQDCYVVTWPEGKIDSSIEHIKQLYRWYLEGDSNRGIKKDRRIAAKYNSSLRFLDHQRRSLVSECGRNG
jgi:hypothetical protein